MNESGEVPAGAGRATWLGGGLWLVTREALTRGGPRMIAFAAGAAALVIPVAPRAEYKHEISAGQAGQTGFVFLLLAPFAGLVLGGVTAALASAGLPPCPGRRLARPRR